MAVDLASKNSSGILLRDEDIQRTADAFADASKLDPMSRWTVFVTWVVTALMIGLAVVARIKSDTTFALDLALWTVDTWSVVFVLVVAFTTAFVGNSEYLWIGHDLSRRIDESVVGLVRKAISAREGGRLVEARNHADMLTAKVPSWPWAFAFRSQLLSATGEDTAALRDMNRAVHLDSSHAWYRIARSELFMRAGDPSSALEDLKSLGDEMPEEAEIMRLRGSALYELGRREESLEYFSKALALDPKDVSMRIHRAKALADNDPSDHSSDNPSGVLRTMLLDEGQRIAVQSVTSRGRERLYEEDLRAAVLDFDLVLEHDPGNLDGLVLRGFALFVLGEDSRALADFDDAISQGAREDYVLSTMARAYRRRGKLLEAEDLYGRSIAVKESAWTVFQRGLTRHSIRDYSGAISDFERAIALDSTHLEAMSHRALSLAKMTNHAASDSQFRDVERMAPTNAHNYTLWVQSLVQRNEPGAALEILERAVFNSPFEGQLYLLRSRVYGALHRYSSAIDDLDSAEKLGVDEIVLSLDRASCLAGMGETEKAESVIGLAAERPSAHQYAALATRATLRRTLKKPESALEDYSSALELNPTQTRLMVSRGCLLLSLSRLDEAMKDFDRAVSLDSRSNTALAHRAEARARSGDREGALLDLDSMEGQSNDHVSPDGIRGHVYFELERWADAATHLRMAMDASTGRQRSEYMSSLAAAYDNAGAFADAEVLFSQLARNEPTPESRLRLAICLSQQGKSDEARELFRLTKFELGDEAEAVFSRNVLPGRLLEEDRVLGDWAVN